MTMSALADCAPTPPPGAGDFLTARPSALTAISDTIRQGTSMARQALDVAAEVDEMIGRHPGAFHVAGPLQPILWNYYQACHGTVERGIAVADCALSAAEATALLAEAIATTEATSTAVLSR